MNSRSNLILLEMVLIFLISPYLDIWTCGNCSQTYFKISMLTVCKLKNHFWTFVRFLELDLVDLGDGTVQNVLFHHRTVLEQDEITCSNTSRNHFQKYELALGICVDLSRYNPGEKITHLRINKTTD